VARDAAGGVGGDEQEMKGWKTNAAVVILIILAVVTSRARDEGWLPGLFLAAALAVVVWRAAYDTGYKDGQRDLVDPPHLRPLTDAQRNELLMQVTLSPTRRYLGWVVMLGGVLIGQSIPIVVGYFVGGVWIFVALVPMMLVFALSAGLSDRIWKPYRDAQRGAVDPREPQGGER
jgi:hypothetical protein